MGLSHSALIKGIKDQYETEQFKSENLRVEQDCYSQPAKIILSGELLLPIKINLKRDNGKNAVIGNSDV